MEDEVRKLPDDLSNVHSRPDGPLKRFQERLTSRYLTAVAALEETVRGISNNCNNALAARMNQYVSEIAEIKEKQNEILATMGSTPRTFDELHGSLEALQQAIITAAKNVHEDTIALYTASFNKVKPAVDATYEEIDEFVNQVPPQYLDRLPFLVRKLNEDYLRTKKELVKTLYNLLLEAQKHNQEIDEEFEQRKGEWKETRANSIVEDAKLKLNPLDQIGFDDVLEEFRRDQAKFTQCAKNLLSNLELLAPPSHFGQADLDKWWGDVQQVLEAHGAFITQFQSKMQVKIDEKNQKNAQLVETVEAELKELKPEEEASEIVGELIPMHKLGMKVRASVLEKVVKYWTTRQESMKKAFDVLKEFLTPLVEHFEKFVNETRESRESVKTRVDEIQSETDKKLSEWETELEQKSNEIHVLVAESDIKERVDACKKLLDDMDAQYRKNYNDVVEIYNGQPELITSMFDECENYAISALKLRKAVAAASVQETVRSESSKSTKSKRMKTQRMSAKRTARGKREPTPPEVEENPIFSFQVESGTRFEEIEPLVLLPTFDDFLEEPPEPLLSSTKSGRGRGKGATQRLNKTLRGPARGRGGRGKGKGEDEELEMPEFSVLDFVPKIDGVVSVWVYVPVEDEISQWTNTFREQMMRAIDSRFSAEIRQASYETEKEELADKLNESLRVHGPRAKDIEMNVADARVRQIASRKGQLEKHFQKSIATFNKGFVNVEKSLETRKENLLTECAKLKRFVGELGDQKTSSSFAMLSQNFRIATKQFLTLCEKKQDEQNKELEKFLNNFKTINDRFLQTVVMADSSFSEEEKQQANEYVEKMNEQIETVVQELKEKQEASWHEVEEAHQAIVNEYEAALPHHKSDVIFGEATVQLQNEFKAKWSSLLVRNKNQEAEVDRLLGQDLTAIGDVPACESENILKDIFAKLDAIRIAILKRGAYLSVLKSHISTEEMPFNISLVDKPGEVEAENTNSDRKRSTRARGKSSLKPSARDKPQKPTGKGAPAVSASASPPVQSFKEIVDELTKEFTVKATKFVTDYYNSLKNRKFEITRPSAIPAQQQEYVESLKKWWQEQISGQKDIMDKSILHFRSQVQTAATSAREVQRVMYDVLGSFYIDLIGRERSDIQNAFDADVRALTQERRGYNDQMSPKLADKNKVKEFNELVSLEENRTQREINAIAKFETDTTECEYRDMRLYTSRLGMLTAFAMSFFDSFLVLDDLGGGETVNVQRKTMRELMKEKERKAAASNAPNGRPFHMRDWPSLLATMAPLADHTPQRSTTPQTSSTRTSRKPGPKKELDKTNSGEQIPVVMGLDTALGRGLIVERNRGYEDYQKALEKRLSDFKVYVQSLKAETDAYSSYWQECIHKLKPDVQETTC